ncbi:MAG: TVP38/TMEM64 family protein [Rhodomicrobium sp.]|nr:MAG: TVP38/TMEM64 family protein [Rhodomicrobium sp.]
MTQQGKPAPKKVAPKKSEPEEAVAPVEQIERNSSLIRRFLPVAILIAVMATVFGTGLHEYLSLKQLALHLEELRSFIESNHFAAIGIYILLYIAIAALSIPGGLIVTVAGGLLFGWFIGTLATVIGATIGATLLFLIARSSLGEPLRERAGPWLSQFQQGFEQDAFNYLLFLRLVPAFPFWLVNLAPAFLGVKLWTYITTTFIGIIPGTLAFAYTGYGLESVIRSQKQAYENCITEKGSEAGCSFTLEASSLVTKEIIIAFILLSVMALLPVLIKRLRNKRNQA